MKLLDSFLLSVLVFTGCFFESCSNTTDVNPSGMFFRDIYFRTYDTSNGLFGTYALNSNGSSLQLISNSGGIISAPYGNKILLAAQDSSISFRKVFTANSDGTNLVTLPLSSYNPVSLKLSPDGQKILFHNENELYVCNSSGSNIVLISSDVSYLNTAPEFSPDSRRIAYIEQYPVLLNRLVIVNTDGSNKVILRERVIASGSSLLSWSPNGNKIVFSNSDTSFYKNLYTINTDGSNYIRLTLKPYSDFAPKWSPDGLKIAFASEINAYFSDIIIINTDGSGYTNISNTPGNYDLAPQWSPDGTKLLYVTFNTLPYDYIRIYDIASLSTTTIADSVNYHAYWNYSK